MRGSARPAERRRRPERADRIILAALLLIPAACSSAAPQRDLQRFRLSGPHTVVESQGTGAVWFALYADSAIRGAEAFAEAPASVQAMVAPRQPRDHPRLGLWRARLVRLQDLSRDPQASAGEIAWVAGELPFGAAVDDALLVHVGDDPDRAARALDHLEVLGISRAAAYPILLTALAAPELADDRAAEWLRSLLRSDNLPAARALAGSPHAGEYTAVAGLADLDLLRSQDRLELYGRFARTLQGLPAWAEVLTDGLAILPRHQRGRAARNLLPAGSAQLHGTLAVRLRELPDTDRLGILVQVIRGPHFAGDLQRACLQAAQDLGHPAGALALEEISRSDRLEPETRALLVR